LQNSGVDISVPKNVKDLSRLFNGALMGTTDNRQIPIIEIKTIEGSGAGHGDRLKGLEGRANKGSGFWVARPRQNATAIITDGDLCKVDGLNNTFP
jgi:hypothetical protein